MRDLLTPLLTSEDSEQIVETDPRSKSPVLQSTGPMTQGFNALSSTIHQQDVGELFEAVNK